MNTKVNDCDYIDEYEGQRCKNCGVFYAWGQAPWDLSYQCENCGEDIHECNCESSIDEEV